MHQVSATAGGTGTRSSSCGGLTSVPSVVSVWSARTPERGRRTNYAHVVPQVSALSTDQDRTPKAGVGGSNLPRRAECLCRSDAVSVRQWPSAQRSARSWVVSSGGSGRVGARGRRREAPSAILGGDATAFPSARFRDLAGGRRAGSQSRRPFLRDEVLVAGLARCRRLDRRRPGARRERLGSRGPCRSHLRLQRSRANPGEREASEEGRP